MPRRMITESVVLADEDHVFSKDEEARVSSTKLRLC